MKVDTKVWNMNSFIKARHTNKKQATTDFSFPETCQGSRGGHSRELLQACEGEQADEAGAGEPEISQ